MNKKRPRVLFFDIETSPITAYVWGLHDQNIGLNQIKKDWSVLSWAAKWLGEEKIYYADNRKAKDVGNDRALLKKIWSLLDEADIVVTQNGKRFDVKKLNARFVVLGMKPPSTFRHIDTLQLAKKYFAFTSNKLEYMAKALDTAVKKMSRRKFDGFTLWDECLKGNREAWVEMETYNKRDVLALEGIYRKLVPWDNSINFNVYNPNGVTECKCGSTRFHKRGFYFTNSGKYQVYRCYECGASTHDRTNLLDKDTRAKLRSGTPR